MLGWRGWSARRIDIGQPDDVSWVMMADPEGSEFCVVSHLESVGKDPASGFAGIGPVAAVFDCMDPEAIAPFWAAATGGLCSDGTLRGVWLRDNRGGGHHLDLHRVSEPKTAQLRVHLDVAPFSDDDHSAEVTSLRAVGAEPGDIGQGDVHGPSLPTPRQRSSASSPLADRTGGGAQRHSRRVSPSIVDMAPDPVKISPKGTKRHPR